MKVYLIGIGGIGMCGVAGILKSLNYQVFGSEKDEIYPPASNILKSLSIPIFNFSSENLQKIKPQVVIIGNSIKKDNIEVKKVQKLKIPYYSFPQFLEKFIIKDKKVLVCAGTHGKSTTTALLSHVLTQLDLNPSYLIGACLKETEINFRVGNSEWFIIEGDEYPSSFFDPLPKFLHYKPFGLILTSLEFDHADVYPNLDSLQNAFQNLINLVPENGVIVFNYDDEILRNLIEKTSPKALCISYGKSNKADFVLLESITLFRKGQFLNKIKVYIKKKGVIEFNLKIPGEYNALNALGVLALIQALGLDPDVAIKHFESFKGIKRRQEIIYTNKNLVIIDDFAHHPTAVKTTFIELKKAIKPEKTILIFEPRTNSSKRKIFQEAYIRSLSLADMIYLKIPPGLENIPEKERIDLQYIKEKLEKKGKEVYFLSEKTFKKIKNMYLKGIKEKTLLIFMSSAAFEEIKKLNKFIFVPFKKLKKELF